MDFEPTVRGARRWDPATPARPIRSRTVATASPGGRFRPFLVGPADARVTTMAVGGTGRALTAFQGADGIVRVTRWSADGHVGRPQALEHAPATQDLTTTIAGRYAIVAWCGGAAGTDVRYATSRDGHPFTTGRSIPGANCGPFLTVAISPRGNAVAAWKVDMYIDAVSYRRPGHAFAPARLIQAQHTLMGRPFVAADARGRTSLSWALASVRRPASCGST